MAYRPEGWEETLREILDRFNVTYMNSDECNLIEAGADVMLEGLKKEGDFYPKGKWTDDSTLETSVAGYVIFIPEEE